MNYVGQALPPEGFSAYCSSNYDKKNCFNQPPILVTNPWLYVQISY